ncbi:MAG TPA: SusE domain-containing protein, partial [Xylanibacter oryzae]|nr:SusE domain-containing protein [Xylanibacter oryzae]
MKTINIASGLMIIASALFFASCDDDRGGNPKLDTDNMPTSFVLNVPAYAENNTYDLANSTSVNFTCSQPDYGGAPLAVNYSVQVSLDKAFTTFKQLGTTYTTANMN